MSEQGIAYCGESASHLYPEENSSEIMGKRLIGKLSEPVVKWFKPSFKLVGLSVSKYHVLAWSSNGSVFSWGFNFRGILGLTNNGENLNKLVSTPTLVDMQLGSSPGICNALALNECSIVINFKGRIHYWGK